MPRAMPRISRFISLRYPARDAGASMAICTPTATTAAEAERLSRRAYCLHQLKRPPIMRCEGRFRRREAMATGADAGDYDRGLMPRGHD